MCFQNIHLAILPQVSLRITGPKFGPKPVTWYGGISGQQTEISLRKFRNFDYIILTLLLLAGLPSYLIDLYFSTRSIPNSLNLKKTSKSKCYTDRAFPTCAPTLWNSISLDIPKSNSVFAKILLLRLLCSPEGLCQTLVLRGRLGLLNVAFLDRTLINSWWALEYL